MTTMLYFRSPMCGTTRIGLQYCTREIIASLLITNLRETKFQSTILNIQLSKTNQ